MAELTDIRETVRDKYAAAAKASAAATETGCCGSDRLARSPADAEGVFGASLYDTAGGEELPRAAIDA